MRPSSSSSTVSLAAWVIVLLASAALSTASGDAGAVPSPAPFLRVLLPRRGNVAALVSSDSVCSNRIYCSFEIILVVMLLVPCSLGRIFFFLQFFCLQLGYSVDWLNLL